jgi:hypothetical protein
MEEECSVDGVIFSFSSFPICVTQSKFCEMCRRQRFSCVLHVFSFSGRGVPVPES